MFGCAMGEQIDHNVKEKLVSVFIYSVRIDYSKLDVTYVQNVLMKLILSLPDSFYIYIHTV